MFAKDRETMRLTPAEVRLILIESLQWCANNAVYFLGLIGAATYDLAGTAFLVAAITLVRNLMTSAGNMVSGSVIDRFGPRRTSFVTCVITAVLSLGVGLAPLSVPGLVFAACVLGLAGGFINTCTHAFPGYLESTTEGRTRVNGLMVFYSNIAYTAGPLLGGAIVSCFATQSVYLLMAGMMGVAAVLSLGCHECVAPAKGEKPKGGILGGMAEGARLTFRDHDLRLIFISGFLGFFAFGECRPGNLLDCSLKRFRPSLDEPHFDKITRRRTREAHVDHRLNLVGRNVIATHLRDAGDHAHLNVHDAAYVRGNCDRKRNQAPEPGDET